MKKPAIVNEQRGDEKQTMGKIEEPQRVKCPANETLRLFVSSPSVSGTFKHDMVLQKLTLNNWPVELWPPDPAVCREHDCFCSVKNI